MNRMTIFVPWIDLILNRVYESLPTPPYTDAEKESVALRAFQHIFSKSQSGQFPKSQAA